LWLSYYYAAHALHWPVNNPTWRRCTSAITRSHSLHEFELTENSRVTGAGIRAVCRRIKVCWWHADEGSIAQAVPLICMQPPSTVSPASPSAMYQGLSHVVLSACTRLHSKTLSGLAKQPLQLLDLSDATSITDVGLSALCDMAGTARKVAMNSYRITSDRLPLFMLTQMALSRRWHCHADGTVTQMALSHWLLPPQRARSSPRVSPTAPTFPWFTPPWCAMSPDTVTRRHPPLWVHGNHRRGCCRAGHVPSPGASGSCRLPCVGLRGYQLW